MALVFNRTDKNLNRMALIQIRIYLFWSWYKDINFGSARTAYIYESVVSKIHAVNAETECGNSALMNKIYENKNGDKKLIGFVLIFVICSVFFRIKGLLFDNCLIWQINIIHSRVTSWIVEKTKSVKVDYSCCYNSKTVNK